MRLALQNTLFLLLFYAVGSAALIWSAGRALDQAAEALVEETARMVGHEVFAAVSEPLLEDLLQHRDRREEEAHSLIRELTAQSEVVQGVTLVGAEGEVVASDDRATTERLFRTPAELFTEDQRPRLTNLRKPQLGFGHYLIELPLLREAEPVAYLRLEISSSQIAELYATSRTRLFWSAVFGLLLIAMLGFLLHVQLSHQAQLLVKTLEGSVEKRDLERGTSGRYEFSRALQMADRLRRDLEHQRDRDHQNQQNLSRLAHLLDVGVLLINPQGKVELSSDVTLDLLGIGSEQEAGHRLESFLSQLAGILEESRQTPEPWIERDLEIEVDGEPRPLSLHVHRLEDQECPGFLILIRDRQVVRALETDLRQAAQMRGLARLYVGVTHDLKAPLNAMGLNLELLKRSLEDGGTGDPEALRERQRRWTQVLEQELQRLRRSLETLLAQTAPAQEKVVDLDLCEVLTEIGELLGPQARQQRVALELSRPDQRLLVRASRDLIKQALLNVAINGLEAMADGGELRLEAEAGGEQLRVRISDKGPGIPDDVAQRIFHMHFTTKPTGTGVGLYVTRSMIHSLGGSIEITSTGPEGTTFEIVLPAAR